MDITTTAQVIQAAQQVSQSGFSPQTLVIAAGILNSHVAQGFAAKLPDSIRPLVIAIGSAVITAGAAVSAGSDWRTAVGYGIGAAAVGKVYHLAALKPDGVLAGLLKALTAPKA